VIPPHVLRAICRNGTPEQREWALATLSLDSTLRLSRAEALATRAATTPGDVLAARKPGTLERTILDAGGRDSVDEARVVREEGDPPSSEDLAVNEAYDGLGATHAFWWDAYARDSIDDRGLPLTGVVHFGTRYDNAFWDGRRMVFGDGDGELFNRFTVAIDIIGHELAHGVTEDEAGLRYTGQAGALNESVSDVFGSLVKQHQLGQAAGDADWLIGAGLLTSRVKGRALRSMLEPGTAYDDPVLGKDPQPAHMDGFVRTATDHGGVHINSGIPNRAFALAATALGGLAWERAGRVWYETLRSPDLRPTASFSAFARLTLRAAQALDGRTGRVRRAVAAGWDAVGVRT
jgi:Zn-dependent metalloprotease